MRLKDKAMLTRQEYHKLKGKKIFGKDDCPLCFDFKAIWKGKYWYLVKNIAPYSGNNQHLMAVPHRHIKYSYELSSEELLELKDVYNFVKDFFDGKEYFSCTRETMGSRSVEHLHIHFIPGKLQGKYIRKMLEHQGFPIKQDLDC